MIKSVIQRTKEMGYSISEEIQQNYSKNQQSILSSKYGSLIAYQNLCYSNAEQMLVKAGLKPAEINAVLSPYKSMLMIYEEVKRNV